MQYTDLFTVSQCISSQRITHVVDVNKTVTNKFKWYWLEEKVQFVFNRGKLANKTQTIVLRDVIGKSSKLGYAYCLFCESEISYELVIEMLLLNVTQKKRIKNYLLHVVIPRYPTLGKVVGACLSIFHGPQVESSFNTMGDMDVKSSQS